MLENTMTIEEDWLARFKSVVEQEIEAAAGSKRSAYRTVAAKLGLGEEFAYQIYNDKPKGRPKRPSKETMDRIERHYPGAGGSNRFAPTESHQPPATLEERPPKPFTDAANPGDIEAAFKCLAGALTGMDETGRRQAQSVLVNLVDTPSQHERLAAFFKVVAQTSKRLVA